MTALHPGMATSLLFEITSLTLITMLLDFIFRKTRHGKNQQPIGDLNHGDKRQVTKAAAAPGTSISYRDDLVPKLKKDHQELLAIYEAIEKSFFDGSIEQTVIGLEGFRTLIQSHLLLENVSLYVYLRRSRPNKKEQSIVTGYQKEMDGIGKAVLDFVGKYQELGRPGKHGLMISFPNDLATVGQILEERIKREEMQLYPLYLPL